MPVEVAGVWNLSCPGCGTPFSADLGKLQWSYLRSFEPSMVVLTYYAARAECPTCSAPLPLELEFSSSGGDFEDPVLVVGSQRLQPVQARCDGQEFWSEV